MSKISNMFKRLFVPKCSCGCSSQKEKSEGCCKTNNSDTKKSEACDCASKKTEQK